MSARKSVSQHVEAAILGKSLRRCCLYFHLKEDFEEKLGQIVHLDHDPSNASEDNLAYLCLDHHTLYDSRASQHKNYTISEVKDARQRLYSKTSTTPSATPRRRILKGVEWVLVLDGMIEEFDKERVEIIAEHLRALLKDPHLSIKRVDKGSVELLIESSEEALDRLKDLWRKGIVRDVLGHRIQEVDRLGEAEFDRFYNRYRDDIIMFISHEIHDRALAEEIASDVFIRAWQEGIPKSNPYLSLRALIRPVMVNTLKRRSQDQWVLLTDVRTSRLRSDVDVESETQREELIAKLNRGLLELRTLERQALLNRYFENYSLNDISRVMGVSTSTAHALIYQGLRNLRKFVQSSR